MKFGNSDIFIHIKCILKVLIFIDIIFLFTFNLYKTWTFVLHVCGWNAPPLSMYLLEVTLIYQLILIFLWKTRHHYLFYYFCYIIPLTIELFESVSCFRFIVLYIHSTKTLCLLNSNFNSDNKLWVFFLLYFEHAYTLWVQS